MGSFPLDQLQVAEPCRASWDEMAGSDATRYCGHCRKHVHNLSAMTADDGHRLICQSAGSLCIRMEYDRGGQLRTLNYEPTKTRWTGSWRKWSIVGLCGALIAGTASAFFFGDRVISTRGGVVMGEITCLPSTLPTTVPTKTQQRVSPAVTPAPTPPSR